MERTDQERRERRAKLLGVAVALGVMVVAGMTIRWPIPGIAAALGFSVYLLARGSRRTG